VTCSQAGLSAVKYSKIKKIIFMGINMDRYVKNKLYIENAPLSKIVEKYSTPLFIYSQTQIENNFNAYKNALTKYNHLICFAAKTNSNYSVLKVLAKLGAGVDAVSGGEIFRALKAGIKAQKIVYAGVGKTAAEIEYALKSNILMFNVESLEELEAINKIAGKLKKKAKIAFRVNPNVDVDTHKYITTGKKGTKFGIEIETARKAYAAAAKMKNILPVGVHCHIGSQILDVKPFTLAAKKLRLLVDSLEKDGIKLNYVNFGGGWGISYKNGVTKAPTGNLINAVLAEFKGHYLKTFIFEPGRSIIGDAGYLAAKITYRKTSAGKSFLITDAGMNDLIRPTLYEAYHEIIPLNKTSAKTVKTDVVGPICESGDFLAQNRQLPVYKQGEILLVKGAGAYGFAMSSQYNSRPLAAEVMVKGKDVKLIRRRSTYKDLLLNEVI
jgi:diaminopimelate decarboxylase